MKKYLKVILAFCSYLFVPQRRPKEEGDKLNKAKY